MSCVESEHRLEAAPGIIYLRDDIFAVSADIGGLSAELAAAGVDVGQVLGDNGKNFALL